MKPFNLELAKQGYPVCTREGVNIRLICFDSLVIRDYPLMGLRRVESADCYDSLEYYNVEGKNCGGDGHTALMMADYDAPEEIAKSLTLDDKLKIKYVECITNLEKYTQESMAALEAKQYELVRYVRNIDKNCVIRFRNLNKRIEALERACGKTFFSTGGPESENRGS